MKTNVDFYKDFNLFHPLVGLVCEVTSPKGVRHVNKDYVSYQLHSGLPTIYNEASMEFKPGLYWVLDIYKEKINIIWNHYLFIIDNDSHVYPVAEYLGETNTEWIPKAIKLVKKYFAGETLEPIEPTHPKPVKSKDTTSSRRFR